MQTVSQTAFKAAFLFAGLFFLVVAIEIVPDMYFMALSMLLVPVAASLASRILSGGIDVRREFSSSCQEGEEVAIALTVTNRAMSPRFFVSVTDRLSPWFECVEQPQPAPQLLPGEIHHAVYRLKARKRGVYTLGPAVCVTADPLGLFARTASLAQPGDTAADSQPPGIFRGADLSIGTAPAPAVPARDQLTVYPQPLPLDAPLVFAGADGWQGDDTGRRRGGGLDFYGVREYQAGDELRRIHWRTTARTGHLVVSEHTQGVAVDVLIALDLSRNAYGEAPDTLDGPFELAIKTAATLAAGLTRSGYAVHLLTSAAPSTVYSNDRRDLAPIFDALARAECTVDGGLAAALSAYFPFNSSGIVLSITTDITAAAVDHAAAEYRTAGIRTLGWRFVTGTYDTLPCRNVELAPVDPEPMVLDIRCGDDLATAIRAVLGSGGRGLRPLAAREAA
ncbi:MAG: DUF58 domain-containing protein [Capsulimonadaceae bacterium]